MANLKFEKLAQDGRARLGRVTMPRGEIMTPVFMPVGTAATVKAMWPGQLRDLGTQISLANTYHLYLQPGEALVEKQGGLHKFMAMEWPLLTDSGGFQVFSLPKKEISEDGVRFAFEKGGEPVFARPSGRCACRWPSAPTSSWPSTCAPTRALQGREARRSERRAGSIAASTR